MLHEVTGKLMNRHHADDLVVQNALLESFGIHNRCLIDFLWLDRPMKDTDALPPTGSRLAGAGDVGAPRARQGPSRHGDGPPELQPARRARGREGLGVLGIGPEVLSTFGQFALEVPDDLIPEGWRERAYAASGTVPPERVKELEKYLIRQDLRPADLPSVPTQALPPDLEV